MLIHGQTSKLQQTLHTTPFLPAGPTEAAPGAGPAASVPFWSTATPADKFRTTASNPFRQVQTQEPHPGLTGMKAGGGCCLPPPKLILPDIGQIQIGLPFETGAGRRNGSEIARTKADLHEARKALEQGLDKARNGGVITAQDGEKIRDAQSKIDKLQADLVGLHMSPGSAGPTPDIQVNPFEPNPLTQPGGRFYKDKPSVMEEVTKQIQVNPFEPNPLTQPGGRFYKDKPGVMEEVTKQIQVNPFEPNPLTQPGGSFWKEVPPPPLEIRPWLCSGG